MTTTLPPPVSQSPPPTRPTWGGGRTALVVLGAVLLLIGTGLSIGGGATLLANGADDRDGFFTAGPGRLTTDTHAISAESLHVHAAGPDAFYGEDDLGTVRVELRPTDAAGALFVGIGPADKVAAYLAGVAHDEFTDLEVDPFVVRYDRQAGGPPATDPAAQTFWTASDAGAGPRTLTWPMAAGDWTLVVMNSDGARGVEVDVTIGAKVPFLRTFGIASLVTGGVMLIGGILLIAVPVATRGRRGRRQPPPAPAGHGTAAHQTGGHS
ncbi:MAG TPA: hypothetical protein VES42_02590 [Pilimelia sp.]|nr:hypothetical protein [Pilimelia sp.]